MKRKDILFLSVLLYIGVVAILVLNFSGAKKIGYTRGVSAAYDHAVGQAQVVYNQKKKLGIDFTDGPCLTNDLLDDWVVDIVHNPRERIDDFVQNQCPALLEGRANHIVELDIEGNVVRVK